MSVINPQSYKSMYQACESCLNRIDKTKTLNAFVTVLKDYALEQASLSERRISDGMAKSKIDGLTIGIKDNFCMENVRTTCASRMLNDFISPYDSTVIKRLKDAGAVIVGKTNLDEFAMGSGTIDSIFGPTKNVYGSSIEYELRNKNPNPTDSTEWRIAGGSSGGSAVAVASGCVFAAIGSDTGGSTRNPASYCGVVGFKPSYGVVSRHGLIPLVNSMDVPGILARNVEDVADVFNIIKGPDDHDSTTVDEHLPPADLRTSLNIRDVVVGIPKEYHHENLCEEVLDAWHRVIKIFQDAGATIKEISMPHTADSIVTYSILNQCEVASNMCRYSGILYGFRNSSTISTDQLIIDSRREGFGPVVRARILAGNYFLLRRNYERYFEKAMKARRLIANDFRDAWTAGVHVLLTPTTLTTAPLFSDFSKLDNRAQCATQDYCTQPANMAGCPAISLPICFSKEELPISLQLIGRNYDDAFLLAVSKWIESAVCFPHLCSEIFR